MELESTALTLSSLQQKELARLNAFKLHSSTRACQDKLAARKRQRTTHSLSSTSFLSIFLLMVISSLTLPSLTLTSLSLPSSFSRFPDCWAQELAEQDELLTTFGKQELVKNELRRTCWDSEIEKQEELPNLLWDQELEKHLEDKSSWVDQLQKNLLENEEDKELDENKELEEQNFQSVIFKKKLVALLPEKHFALAASSQLLGNEAWEKYREASEEISFDKVRGKELSQELRREQLDCKELRSDSFRALCPSNFEDSSFKKRPSKKRPSQRAPSQRRASKRAAFQKAASQRAASHRTA